MTTINDVFTYLQNMKNKMDSIRDIFNLMRNQVATNTQLISELQEKNRKLEFILRNVGIKLEVEVDEQEPEAEPLW